MMEEIVPDEEDPTWTLHDASGPVRSGIQEEELFHLLRKNAEEGNDVYVVNSDGTRRASLQVLEQVPAPIEEANTSGE